MAFHLGCWAPTTLIFRGGDTQDASLWLTRHGALVGRQESPREQGLCPVLGCARSSLRTSRREGADKQLWDEW